MNVQDIMTREVPRVRPEDGLDRAAHLMQDYACGCVAVVDAEQKLVGVLTDRDVCLAGLRVDEPLSRITIGAAMSAEVFTCSPDDMIAEAERRMGQHQVRRLPVVDAAGRLLGILSLDDIAREAFREEDLIAPPVSTQAVGHTLGEIARRRLLIRKEPLSRTGRTAPAAGRSS